MDTKKFRIEIEKEIKDTNNKRLNLDETSKYYEQQKFFYLGYVTALVFCVNTLSELENE